MQIHNAVLQLRQQRLARSTRPFRARGSRVARCTGCLLPKTYCFCTPYQAILAQSRFVLLMYDTEPLKPSNTGRLIADILSDTQAFLWHRCQADPQLLSLLADPAYQPYIVFPAEHLQLKTRVCQQISLLAKQRPLFIILDGTWAESKKMFRKSPYLADYPVISLHLHQLSAYILRETSHNNHYCTVEVAIALLQQMQDSLAMQALEQHFIRFKQHYLAAKFNRTINTI